MSSYPSSKKKLKSKELVGECMYYLLMNSYATPRGCQSNTLFGDFFTEIIYHSAACVRQCRSVSVGRRRRCRRLE